MPPKEILMNFLFVAFAIDFPKDVLPTPGGPTKHRIGPFIFESVFEQQETLLSSP